MEEQEERTSSPPVVTAPGEMYQREQTEFPHTEVDGTPEVPILNNLRPGFWEQ